ncbi:MAG: glycosyltransferase [Proteobacteria bacterium]|nr:glycosyltransferase [Pseudomonadota bacterium]
MGISELLLLPFFVCFVLSVLGFLLHPPFFLYLIFACRRKNAGKKETLQIYDKERLPLQIIQLPVFNEDVDMVKALIDSACGVWYPREKVIIQLLDDSDQESISLALKEYVDLKKSQVPGVQLHYLHRSDRSNYKAGNLNFGLGEVRKSFPDKGEAELDQSIVSIFDADFLIPDEYLRYTVGYFDDPSVGAVQADMDFANRNDSALTRAAAVFQENLHRIDFTGRSVSGHLTTFKGSAGSLRYRLIRDCGFWQGDTQIEDVDLSFAAQAKGWKIVYTDLVSCSCVLPSSYNDFKLQQRSWMKGIMEVMRKQLGGVLGSSRLGFFQKLLALEFFLVFSLQSMFMVVSHLTLIPAYYFWSSIGEAWIFHGLVLALPLILALTHIPFIAVRMGNPETADQTRSSLPGKEPLFAFALMTALFVTLSYGLIEGLSGAVVHRDRTGKVGRKKEGRKGTITAGTSIVILGRINGVEWLMALYSILVVCWAGLNGFVAIATVYSVLAVIYPLNAIISFWLLPKRTRVEK